MASDADCIHLLTHPPSGETAQLGLLPQLREWFAAAYGQPTAVQRFAWPTILRGEHLLLSSPTGSGKTLAAFLPILSGILAEPTPGLRCLYVSPLKALGRDVRTNLKRAWRAIQQAGYFAAHDLSIGLRTGDTPQRVRQRQISDPPAILLTTPESLAQMLANAYAQELFRSLRWVILDEIHALVGSKRGADVSLSLERLSEINDRARIGCSRVRQNAGVRAASPRSGERGYSTISHGDLERDDNGLQRIGLSATCAPLATAAGFLVGHGRSCTAAQVSDVVEKQLVIEPLFADLGYAPGWMRTLVDRLDRELACRRTTLIFTNTRSLAERLTWALRRRYPERHDDIAVHHSSLSAARRRSVERKMKQGRLWAVVSSTSLELGIDIGTVDSVVFVHPPGGVTRLLQRVGRSGHRPEEPRRGLLLASSPGELLESAVTAGSGQAGQIEATAALAQPLDVLCQHLAGMAMTGLWEPAQAYGLIRRAAPYRELAWRDFQDCLDYLSGRRRDGAAWLPPRLRWEGDSFTIASAATAKLLRRNLGSILTEDACAIRMRVSSEGDEEPHTRLVGEIDDVYAERLRPGDRFVLDGRCLEMKERGGAGVLVEEVIGRPQFPRWLGGGVPMSAELARRIYLFRVQAAEALRDGGAAFRALLQGEFRLGTAAASALRTYLLRQETVSEIPALPVLLIECVTMQACQEYYLHTPLPRSANETLARVLIERWQQDHRVRDSACARSRVRQNAGGTDTNPRVLANAATAQSQPSGRPPLTALAGDLGIHVLATGSEPMLPDLWRTLLRAEGFADDFQAHLAGSDLVREHFGKVAQTGLMVLRHPQGRRRKVGGKDWTARRLYEQIRAGAADFVLLRQTEAEVKHTLCNVPTALAFAANLDAMSIRLRHLHEPSPFGESILRFSAQAGLITGALMFVGAAG